MNGTTTPATLSASLNQSTPKPNVNIVQIDNGFLLSWYDNKTYQQHQVHAADLQEVGNKLAEFFA